MRCVVCVGTTEFAPLTAACEIEIFSNFLKYVGVTSVAIQYGSAPRPALQSTDTLKVELFDYTPDLSSYISAADMIISHAGAGIILETCRSNAAVHLIVVNDKLMNNHQVELARQMPQVSPVPLCRWYENPAAYVAAVSGNGEHGEDLKSSVKKMLLKGRHGGQQKSTGFGNIVRQELAK
ncbi:Glycosyltransferase family 28 C-terminal domain [Carpediemonas membranifera]|uniref:UDP-N-acetylglucosamine transferase subunit ALG13 n=1 Tax=Carpediemonas membranifera TaxID=201153 RepID=A0A8J6E1Q3_9EUKA|nr:Glycosyltransferase family 28 C-terminal domain [Carpediemonas membranifera]|eukprot:KAG9393341.1 Glycosyltransferase family 28 C-terminal domain [Carpediemonas membranifera]